MLCLLSPFTPFLVLGREVCTILLLPIEVPYLDSLEGASRLYIK